MADQAYCPTCQTERTLVMNEEAETSDSMTMQEFPKKCPVCNRKFTWDGYTRTL